MSKYTANIHLEDQNNTTTQIFNKIKSKSLVLDVGCASGYFAKLIKEKKGSEIIGIEIDEQDAKKAEDFCKTVLRDDIETLGWEKKLKNYKFDHIIFADVLEHLKDPTKTLIRVGRFLKPDGTVLISVPNVAHVSIRLELLAGNFRSEKTGILDETHLRFFTKDSFLEMIQKAGFQAKTIAAYSFEFPDKLVIEYLERLGLKASQEALELLSSPEAVAHQYFFELVQGRTKKITTKENKPIYNVRKFLTAVEEDHRRFKKVYEKEIQKLRDLNNLLTTQNSQLREQLNSVERRIGKRIKKTLLSLVKGNKVNDP